MQCKEWDDANSELFKESHDEAMHKNSYKSRLYELISASQGAKAVVGAFKKVGRRFVFPKGPAAARQRGIWPCANARAKGCGR